MYSYYDQLSPSHLDPNLPIPAKADLSMIIVLLLLSLKYSWVALTSMVPKREWVSIC